MSQFKEYWQERVGKDWTYLFTEAQKELEYSITNYKKEIKNGFLIYPEPTNIFKAFKITPYKELKVIILGEIYTDSNSTGLAFANDPSKVIFYNDNLEQIHKCCELFRKTAFETFDPSLESWAKQGILLLNTSLTTQANRLQSHNWMWKGFIEKIINEISSRNSGLIFCLWGINSKQYKKLINQNLHYVLEYTSPIAYNNKNWKCPHFQEINTILKQNNNITISWLD